MINVKGATGYSASVQQFIRATDAIKFENLHRPYLEFIPTQSSRILDVGAGVGRDASVLASMGHEVVAVEPVPEFLEAAKKFHDSAKIQWVNDSLPDLKRLGEKKDQFDFILASAVWHHLNESERVNSFRRIAELIRSGSIFALSLRNGPAGVGTHIFPTDFQQTIDLALDLGFEEVITLTDQPSLIAGKTNVKWSKLAFKKL